MAENRPGSEKREPLLVAAIDFGTTYSGSAYSFRHDFVKDPTKIYAREWSGGSLMSAKAPTCVLIRQDGTTLEAFGFDAEDRYAELVADDEHHQYYFFKHFKMMLYGKKDLKRTTMLEDMHGKQLPAMTVFALAIKFLKDDLVKMCEKRVFSQGFKPSDIQWVLTVPAIWNDSAKLFMREAATDKDYAAIQDEMLTIALEPEAASVYCRHLLVKKSSEQSVAISELEPGTKYMVVDAGGGTIDISVHQIKDNNTLKELHKSSGGDWGGTKVDEALVRFFIELAGKDVWTEFQQQHIEDFLDLFRDWEVKKRKVDPQGNAKFTFRLPQSLREIYLRKNEVTIEKSLPTELQGRIELKGDKIRIDAEVVKGFFGQVLEESVTHIKELLRDPHLQGLSNMLLVGGFSECKTLQSGISENIPGLNVVIPDDAGLVVLKGAVIFGHSPTYISERVVRLTYGVAQVVPFNAKIHLASKCVLRRNTLYCEHIFGQCIQMGQSVHINEASPDLEGCFEAHDDSTLYRIAVFCSTELSPTYVTDASCYLLGMIQFENKEIPALAAGQITPVTVRMYFGRTEVEIEAEVLATGAVRRLRIDCL